MDVIGVFRRTASREPDRTFAFDGATTVTYAEAESRSDAVAGELARRGVTEGQPLALCSPDSVVLLLAILGAWKAGAMPSLVDARTTPEDLPYFLGDIGAKVVAAPASLHERLVEAGAVEVIELSSLVRGEEEGVARHGPDAPLYLSYTSGTTGRPKGAILRSGPVTVGTACIADRLDLHRDDVLLATTPAASSFQLVAAVMPAIHVGASIGLVAGLPVEQILAVARERRASVLVAYPLTLSDVVNAVREQGAETPFRLALSGGSPLAPRIKRDYREHLGVPLVESYGQSELGGFMALGRADDDRASPGFVGRPLPDRPAHVAGPDGREVPAGEIGEVVVPEGYFAGYWNMPEETERTTAGGVLHCGDLGVADADGALKVLGRTREGERAARRGGFLRDLEDALYEHPDVQHAAVVERDGGIHAFAELRRGGSVEGGDLAAFAAERVAEGLRPAGVEILPAMPRTFSGKADRRRLEGAI